MPRSQGISVLVQIQEFSSPFFAAFFYFVVFVFANVVAVAVVLFLLDDEIDSGHPIVDELTGGERGRYQERQPEA